MNNQEEIIQTIKDILDLQEQQINPNREKIEKVLKNAQRDFPIESTMFELGGADNNGLVPIEDIDFNVLYNKLPFYKSFYLNKLKNKLKNEKKYNDIIKKYNIN